MEGLKPKVKPKTSIGAILAPGTYTDIISMNAPFSAVVGEEITVEVTVKNLATYAIYIAVTGIYDNTELLFNPDYIAVEPGAYYTFSGTFTMLNKNVRVRAWSFYWSSPEWYQDDEQYVDIALIPGYPKADIASLNVTVTGGITYPSADIRNLAVLVTGGIEYPAADIRALEVSIIGVEFPKADIQNLEVTVSGGLPPEAELFSHLTVTYKKL